MSRLKKGPKKRPPKLGKVVTVKKATSSYIRLPITESIDKFKEIGELVKKKKLKWAYYVVENNIGVHYYLILK